MLTLRNDVVRISLEVGEMSKSGVLKLELLKSD